MKITAVISVVLLIVTGVGCTSRNIYEGLRMQQEMECQRLQGADHDECSKISGMSYDEYQRQLKERQNDK